ncbi:hypothetical protein FHS96_005085 [Sphingomonas zeicaulis]|uniref:RES family NAD+ phosphorylase n=1 Tax=Sphingomonas zeicaulis TaxID=1632740 RepID=UPI003D25233F
MAEATGAGAPLPPGDRAVPAATIPTPPSRLDALVKRISWSKGRVIHRIHPAIYAADQFNPGPKGNARFSPIFDAKGNGIPTIYGGTTFDCAAMETVFHDVPFVAGLKTHAKRKLRQHLHSQIVVTADLQLADLTGTALRKLGIMRGDLIDSEKNVYPQTRAWAEAIHARCKDVQGLYWISRQDDRAVAIILFGDRMGATTLTAHAPSADIVDDAATYADVLKLAARIGVRVTGK